MNVTVSTTVEDRHHYVLGPIADYLRLSRVTARLWRLLQIFRFCARSWCRPSGECPDGGALDVVAFQHALAGNVVAGQWPQPVARQMVPAEVADQDGGSAGVASLGEPRHLAGQVPLVEGVGNQNQIGGASMPAAASVAVNGAGTPSEVKAALCAAPASLARRRSRRRAGLRVDELSCHEGRLPD